MTSPTIYPKRLPPSVMFGLVLMLSIPFACMASGEWLGISADRDVYRSYYYDFARFSTTMYTQIEPGFRLIFRVLNIFDVSLAGMYFVTAVLSLLAKISTLTRAYPSAIPVTLYLLAFYPLHEYTQVRVSSAVALLYIATFIIEKRKKTGMALIIASVFLHYSTILFAFCYILFLGIKRLGQRTAAIGIIALLFSAKIASHLAATRVSFSNLETYANKDYGLTPTIFTLSNLLYIVAMIIGSRIRARTNPDLFRFTYAICCLAPISLIVFKEIPTLAFRYKELFSAFSPLLVASILQQRETTLWRIGTVTFICLFAIVTFAGYLSRGLIIIG